MKLVLADEASERVTDLWQDAAGVVAAAIIYVETRAAVAAAARAQRLDRRGLDQARDELEARWRQVDALEVDDELLRAAADAAERFALRALDAVHLAAAIALDEPELVFATWDEDLRRAARASGLAVAPA